jgi:hypothetical protein
MTKVSKKSELDNVLDSLSNAAPIISFIVAVGAFTLVAIFKSDYYAGIFSTRWPSFALPAGIAIAAITESARAVLLLMTFADFRKGNNRGGWLGLVLSIGLVVYDSTSAGAISSLWTGTHTGQVGGIIADLLVFLVVLSFGIEFRLVLARGGRGTDKEDTNESSEAKEAYRGNGVHA